MSEIMLNRGAGWWPLEYGHYPDTLPMVNLWDSTSFPLSICLRPVSLDSFMTGLFFVDALQERGQRDIVLHLPCIPGARQDRLNNKGDYLFTLKSIAKEINMRNFLRVETWDTHSDVSYLIDRLHVKSAADALLKKWNFNNFPFQAIIAPDAGAAKRAGAVADLYGVPLVQAWKHREVGTGKLSGFGVDISTLLDIDDKFVSAKYLVVDDLCDGGGTFIGLAKALQWDIAAATARTSLYITHGLFTKGTKELLDRFFTIYTTNSTLAAETAAGVKVINIL